MTAAFPFLSINEFSDIPGAISRMQAAGAGHRVPIMQALYAGRIAHLEVSRNTPSRRFKQWTRLARLPSLALIGDDDYADQAGPGTWRLAERVLRWARSVIIHGGRGEPEHYTMAVHLAETAGRVVMVECASVNVLAWHGAADKWAPVPRLTLAPEVGTIHPNDSRERMQ